MATESLKYHQPQTHATRPRPVQASRFKIQPYRKAVQVGFLLLTLWIGLEFTLFVWQLQDGAIPTVQRPPGVEAFLPISALISLKYWLLTGIFNQVHPSAAVLLLIILVSAFFLKKGFCSWVCPVGLLSEYLARLNRMFRRGKTKRRKHATPRGLPRWADYPLRGIKYLLLAFFLWAVLVQMDVITLEKFIYSPYNRVADIKMWAFFAEPSALTLYVLGALVFLSVVVPYFWCRYLCPYGALLGAVSLVSPWQIRRNRATCTDCGKCSKVCPARIQVHTARWVASDECHACLKCVDACPVKDTLYLALPAHKAKMPRLAYAALIVLLFLLGTSAARLAGYWHNRISGEEYLRHMQQLDSPVYQHNRGEVPEYE
ncbi:MAG: 4Fe-4S binding protein [Candidatus Zixiibacteriota bacterium]|nr:MAG: 4Fe-4S binding protein [candidate division Zixibacteria bacterium]